MPGMLPANPGKIRERTFENSALPGVTRIETYINSGDTFVTRKSYAPDIGSLIGRNVDGNERSVDARSHTNGSGIAPAALLPVALIILFHDFNAFQPFTVLHAIDT